MKCIGVHARMHARNKIRLDAPVPLHPSIHPSIRHSFSLRPPPLLLLASLRHHPCLDFAYASTAASAVLFASRTAVAIVLA